MNVQLLRLGLRNGGQRVAAVAIAAGVGGNSQAVLQNFQIQIAVVSHVCGLVPDPNKVTAAGGVCVPLVGIGLQNDRTRLGKGFLGKLGSGLAVFLDFAGGLRGVDGQESCLQHAAGHHRLRHIEMNRVAVNEVFDRYFLLQRRRTHVQLYGSSVVNNLNLRVCGCVGSAVGRTAGHHA